MRIPQSLISICFLCFLSNFAWPDDDLPNRIEISGDASEEVTNISKLVKYLLEPLVWDTNGKSLNWGGDWNKTIKEMDNGADCNVGGVQYLFKLSDVKPIIAELDVAHVQTYDDKKERLALLKVDDNIHKLVSFHSDAGFESDGTGSILEVNAPECPIKPGSASGKSPVLVACLHDDMSVLCPDDFQADELTQKRIRQAQSSEMRILILTSLSTNLQRLTQGVDLRYEPDQKHWRQELAVRYLLKSDLKGHADKSSESDNLCKKLNNLVATLECD